MIEIFVTFYSQNWFSHIVLPLLRDCLESIERLSDYPHQTYIVDNGSDKEVVEQLLAWECPVIVNANAWKCYTTLMNTAIKSAKSDPFVILHGDMRVTKGWLKTLVEEHAYCEEYFKCSCALTPHFLHYEATPDHIVWKETKKGSGNLVTSEEMRRICDQYNIPYEVGIGVISKPPYRGSIQMSGTPITDDGGQLMSFIASQAFFKEAGLYDEDFTGAAYEDNEMGIRALMKGLKVLQTHDVYIHHTPCASAGRGSMRSMGRSPYDVFVEKYGEETWNAMQTGQLWVDLHKKQRKE